MVVDGIDGGTNGARTSGLLSGMCKRYAPISKHVRAFVGKYGDGRGGMFASGDTLLAIRYARSPLLPAARACLSLQNGEAERERERQREILMERMCARSHSAAIRWQTANSLGKCGLRSFRRSCMSYIPSSHIFPLSRIAKCARNSARSRGGGKRNANRKFQRIIFPPATSLPRSR